MRYILLFLSISFALGIIINYYLPISFIYPFLLILFLIPSLFFYRNKKRFVVAITVLFFLLGIAYEGVYSYLPENHINNITLLQKTAIIGVVNSPVEIKRYSEKKTLTTFTLSGKKYRSENGWKKVQGKIKVNAYYLKNEIKYGDEIRLWGELTKPKRATNPSQFDYRNYLKKYGIHVLMNVYGDKCVKNYGPLKNRSIFRKCCDASLRMIFDLRTEIKEKIEQPLGGPQLEKMAMDKRQAVIVFDDMTRPTPVRAVAPYILKSLHRAGMKKDQIRFVWSLGAHGAYDMISARKKLGGEIVENYGVYNHDPFQNTVRMGRTPTGLELLFNREVIACDLKIGIGCISAHVHVGFGGGAKIILPGIAGIESINQFHNQFYRDPGRAGLGNFDDNIMRAECDAAGDITGLNFKVDCLINRRGEITNLYAGPFRATHRAGAEEGKEHYGIPHATG